MTLRANILLILGLLMVFVSVGVRVAIKASEKSSLEQARRQFLRLADLGIQGEVEWTSTAYELLSSGSQIKSINDSLDDMEYQLVVSSPAMAYVTVVGGELPKAAPIATPTIIPLNTNIILETLFCYGEFKADQFATDVIVIPPKPLTKILQRLVWPGLLMLGWALFETKKQIKPNNEAPKSSRPSSVKDETSSLDTVIRSKPPVAPGGLFQHDPSTPEEKRFGRFVQGELVGQGSMGEVFKCFNCLPGDDNTYALKLLLPEWSEADDFRSRFEREAQICESLAHPNLVRAFEHGEKDGRLWMVMDFVEGLELGDWLTESPRTEQEIVQLADQLCDGLGYAHDKDVIHRDLKPGNIIIRQNGQPVIADFGLARGKHYATITKTNSTLGTPLYMPPEQITGGKGSPQGDLYSLGCILYEALAGKPIYEQTDVIQLLTLKLTQGDAPELEPGTASPEMSAVVAKLIAQQTIKRYQSAAEVKESLARLK